MAYVNSLGFYTLLRKEMKRVVRIAAQTLLAPVVSTGLYLLVFGTSLGARINNLNGIPYVQFIIPGLIMMSLVMNAFSNTAFSLFLAKFQGTIVDLLITPISNFEIVLAYTLVATLRALAIGVIIYIVGLFFTPIHIFNIWYVLLFSILVSFTFALLGIVVAIIAKNFDEVSLLPTFVITPLSFLGGVFFSLDLLPHFWRIVSRFNPMLYMIDGLRYGFFGISDVNPAWGIIIVGVLLAIVSTIAWWMFRTGYKLKT